MDQLVKVASPAVEEEIQTIIGQEDIIMVIQNNIDFVTLDPTYGFHYMTESNMFMWSPLWLMGMGAPRLYCLDMSWLNLI